MSQLSSLISLLSKLGFNSESDYIRKFSIDYSQVKERLYSKKFEKAIKKYFFGNDLRVIPEDFWDESSQEYSDFMKIYQDIAGALEWAIPSDITEQDRAHALNWVITVFVRDPDKHNPQILGTSILSEVRSSLETFFQIKEQGFEGILQEPDIYQYQDYISFVRAVENVSYTYKKLLEERISTKDVAGGMNKIFEDEEYEVYIPTNKAAACHLGKGTEWCTAAPGLSYYEDYHSPDDPLIIFMHKADEKQRVQFSFGSKQFMDVNDEDIPYQLLTKLTSKLLNGETVPDNVKKLAKEYDDSHLKTSPENLQLNSDDVSKGFGDSESAHVMSENLHLYYEEREDDPYDLRGKAFTEGVKKRFDSFQHDTDKDRFFRNIIQIVNENIYKGVTKSWASRKVLGAFIHEADSDIDFTISQYTNDSDIVETLVERYKSDALSESGYLGDIYSELVHRNTSWSRKPRILMKIFENILKSNVKWQGAWSFMSRAIKKISKDYVQKHIEKFKADPDVNPENLNIAIEGIQLL